MRTVKMHFSVNDRIKEKIHSSQDDVFLRSDFSDVGNYRQVSRALNALEHDGLIERAGYGIYIRPAKQRNVREIVSQVQRRLASKSRVKRHLTIGDVNVEIGASSNQRNVQSSLDRKKLRRAKLLIRHVDLKTLRREGLANIDRWNANNVWVSAHDEWRELLQNADDSTLVNVITGTDENSNRLRQSFPFPGLLHQAGAKSHESQTT